jgi:fructose-1,6-bisphosphatase/inositol monophosphatase family enzyme
MKQQYRDILIFMKALARDAGAIMMDFYGKNYGVYTKPDRSQVTDVDLAISKMVHKKIEARFPEIALFSEESENPPIDPTKQYFVIDELDGTSNFIDKLPGFSHLAAFYDGENGLVIGVGYFPLDDELIYAVKGRGVWLEKGGRTIEVATPASKPYHQLLYAHGFRYKGDKYLKLFRTLGVRGDHVVYYHGFRALEIAKGNFDVAISLVRSIPDWDLAAEKVILEELGFNHSYLDGSSVRFGEKPAKDNRGYLICPGEHRERLIKEIWEREV